MATIGPGWKILDGIDEIDERARQRLAFLYGEWYQAQDDGVPYFTELLGRQLSPQLLATALGSQVQEIEGVISVLDARGEFDDDGMFDVSLDIVTVYGTTTIGVRVSG